ncbi:MAG: GatB/YqeY domain-containing protein [Gammaproteobacteria bacterium]
MSLQDRIQQDMKDAMRSGDKPRRDVIRLILAAIKQREVDERIVLNDDQILVVLDKMAKQRRESIEQFTKANRNDLVEQENFELGIIKYYLPEQLDDSAIDALIDEALQTTGASTIKDMGKVMGILKPKLQGRADMSTVSGRIKSKLS